MTMTRSIALVTLVALALTTPAFADGTLFVGTDTEEFNSVLPDRLGRYTTNGPAIVGAGTIISLDYHLNGMGNGGGFLYAGDALTSSLRTIGYDGTLLTEVAAGFASGCCNEEMVFDGTNLYHAHFSPFTGSIQRIDPTTGVVLFTYPQNDVVGMALVGSEIWISKWQAKAVGTWDPGSNTFTPVFGTASNAGGLAYDPNDDVLWVGREGGFVGPYDLTGASLGPEFQPFGPIPDTIDGLELVCAPTVSAGSANPSVLWPPNHKMVNVTLDYTAEGCGGTVNCTVVSISSNEPVNGVGDGNTSPDWEIVDATHVRLRAERSGPGSGRVYTITVRCTDAAGQTSDTTIIVTVPHDQGS
jgi:hypothetical protein